LNAVKKLLISVLVVVNRCVENVADVIIIFALDALLRQNLKNNMNHPIEYYDRVAVRYNGRSVTAYRVGAYLFVMKFRNGYRIFKMNKTALLKSNFINLNDAITMAEKMLDLYGEYFCIWDDYPDVDVTNLAKWTIDDGLNLYETWQLLNDVTIINKLGEQVNNCYYRAKEFAHAKWTGGFRNYLGAT